MSKKCYLENKHAEMGENVEKCFMCHKKIGKSLIEKTKEKVSKISLEKRQEFMDIIHSGKTVGEAEEITGINDTLIAGEILMQNIGNIKYLKKEVSQ